MSEAEAQVDEEISRDTLLRGRVVVYQPKRGYRFSLDPVLLAGFIGERPGHFLDVGAGCGVLGLLLFAKHPEATGVAIELQPRLAALAARSFCESGADRLTLVNADFLAWASEQAPEQFDLVASNPPFYQVEGGHPSPNLERALAHHELAMSLGAWTAAAARLLRPSGRMAVVFPAEREGELLAALQAQGLSQVRLRRARPRRGHSVHRVLVEARRGPPRLDLESELVVHDDGGFSLEVLRDLGERP